MPSTWPHGPDSSTKRIVLPNFLFTRLSPWFGSLAFSAGSLWKMGFSVSEWVHVCVCVCVGGIWWHFMSRFHVFCPADTHTLRGCVVFKWLYMGAAVPHWLWPRTHPILLWGDPLVNLRALVHALTSTAHSLKFTTTHTHTHTSHCSLYHAHSVVPVSLFISTSVVFCSVSLLFCLHLFLSHAPCFSRQLSLSLAFYCFSVVVTQIYTSRHTHTHTHTPLSFSFPLSVPDSVRNITCQGQPQWSAVNQTGAGREACMQGTECMLRCVHKCVCLCLCVCAVQGGGAGCVWGRGLPVWGLKR